MTILDEIASFARIRVEKDKGLIPPEEMKRLAAAQMKGEENCFYEAIEQDGMSFICEVKKASPSKGIIDPVFDYLQIASDYEEAGAECISCLTEPEWFKGSDDIFRNIRKKIRIPMLRKDFVVDEYQIYQAKTMGADCVLLISSLLDTKTIYEYLGICREIHLAALVETHDEIEISSAVEAGARMIGVNNRNLKDFSVDLENASRLRDLIPSSCLYVCESGVKTPEDARRMKEIGADAILIGEAMMRAGNKKEALQKLREAAR